MQSNRGVYAVKFAVAATILAVVILSMLAPNSSAHLPVFDTGGDSYETAETIDNLETSYAFYGELPEMTPGDPVGAKYYTFEGTSDQEFAFEVGVEHYLFYPCVLLVGPGLPDPDNDTLNVVESSGLEVPDGQGALGWSRVLHPLVDIYPKSEFEPFTQTKFYYVYRVSVSLPADGDYYVILTGVVYSEYTEDYQITHGKYFLVTGYKEEFTLLDFVLMPYYWLKVQSLWSQDGEALFLLPTAAVLAGLLTAEAFVRRKDLAFREQALSKKALYFGALTGAYVMIGGAVHQLLLIAIYSGLHDWEGIVILVVALQVGGLVLGIASSGLTKNRFFHLRSVDLIVSIVIAAMALIVGAGFIIGPVLLLCSVAIAMSFDHRSCRERP